MRDAWAAPTRNDVHGDLCAAWLSWPLRYTCDAGVNSAPPRRASALKSGDEESFQEGPACLSLSSSIFPSLSPFLLEFSYSFWLVSAHLPNSFILSVPNFSFLNLGKFFSSFLPFEIMSHVSSISQPGSDLRYSVGTCSSVRVWKKSPWGSTGCWKRRHEQSELCVWLSRS